MKQFPLAANLRCLAVQCDRMVGQENRSQKTCLPSWKLATQKLGGIARKPFGCIPVSRTAHSSAPAATRWDPSFPRFTGGAPKPAYEGSEDAFGVFSFPSQTTSSLFLGCLCSFSLCGTPQRPLAAAPNTPRKAVVN